MLFGVRNIFNTRKLSRKLTKLTFYDVFAGSSCHKFRGFSKDSERLFDTPCGWLKEKLIFTAVCTVDPELSVSYINSLGSIWVFLAPSLAPHGVFPGLLGQFISVTYNLWRQIGDKISWPWKRFFASKIVLRVIVCCLRCSIRWRRKETSSKHKLAGGLFKMADLKPSMQCKPNPTFPPSPLKGKLCKYNKRTTRGIIRTHQNVHVKHWGTHSSMFN